MKGTVEDGVQSIVELILLADRRLFRLIRLVFLVTN